MTAETASTFPSSPAAALAPESFPHNQARIAGPGECGVRRGGGAGLAAPQRGLTAVNRPAAPEGEPPAGGLGL